MFLRRVVIENIRSIKHLELNCLDAKRQTRRWTLLLGENGCGKSTILRSIALALVGSEALTEILREPDSWIRSGESFGKVSLELATADGKPRHTELVLRRGVGLSSVLRENDRSLRALDAALKHSPRNYLTLGYGASRRIHTEAATGASPDRSGPARSPRARGVATLFFPDAALEPLEPWILSLESQKKGAGAAMMRAIDEHLLPDITFRHVDLKAGKLIFATPDGDTPLALLSDGYQEVASWTGDLLRNVSTIFRDHKNPLQARGLLIIDELDLHLHPVWQRRLRSFLESTLPNMQFVASTYSPLAAQQSGPGELHIVRRPTPKSPSKVQVFEGTPRDMMIHQVLVSPIFGLTTGDSKAVQDKRAAYRRIAAKPRPTVAEVTAQRRLAAELRTLPDISARWDGELSPHRANMERILKAMQPRIASAATTAATSRALKGGVTTVVEAVAARDLARIPKNSGGKAKPKAPKHKAKVRTRKAPRRRGGSK